ncbi:hypothetical protein QL093DRAFT_2238345 [Fusarium oxysporum]|nr:hypothetical protein QL093DRAFT_2238345 [Fusarium oxysporum]
MNTTAAINDEHIAMHISHIPRLIPSICLGSHQPVGSRGWQTHRELCDGPGQSARHGAIPLALSGLPTPRWHANRKPRHRNCIIPFTDRIVPWRVAMHQGALDSPRLIVTE